MIERKTKQEISKKLMENLTSQQIKLEIGRFIEEDPLFPNILKIWVIKLNERQINERSVDFDEYKNIQIQLTFTPPNFFSDVIRGQNNVPYWQVATVVRSLKFAYPVYDPDNFIQNHIDAIAELKWSNEFIEEKKAVTRELIKKAKKYGLEEDMLADGYIWAVKAAEEAICIPLMQKNLFGITTPTLLLDTMRTEKNLYEFYLQLLGVDTFTPDLAFIALGEIERLADHLYHANENNSRSSWILGSFVSINQAERKLNRIFNQAGNIHSMELQKQFEDALAELFHAFFLLAQTPGNQITPLDPWVVGLAWKWFTKESDLADFPYILKKIQEILDLGTIESYY
ncbi:MAG: hypothetical protein ACFFD1_05915 [Candidatus Thorarchaeota archaeon]